MNPEVSIKFIKKIEKLFEIQQNVELHTGCRISDFVLAVREVPVPLVPPSQNECFAWHRNHLIIFLMMKRSRFHRMTLPSIDKESHCSLKMIQYSIVSSQKK